MTKIHKLHGACNYIEKSGMKSHTKTAKRIAQRYGGDYTKGDGIDIIIDDLSIEVETSPTLSAGVARLKDLPGRIYVAVTNLESIEDALEHVIGTRVGVMDPEGNIVLECGAA